MYIYIRILRTIVASERGLPSGILMYIYIRIPLGIRDISGDELLVFVGKMAVLEAAGKAAHKPAPEAAEPAGK